MQCRVQAKCQRPAMPRACLATMMIMTMGCSGGPPALQPPDLDPVEAAAGAIELYDADGNGSLSLVELDACPGMKKMMSRYDIDGDTTISQAEIENRLQSYVDSRTALVPLSAKVRLNNRPLPGATVRFVPEPYFDNSVKLASGITAASGSARIAVAAEDLPENQRMIRGVQVGTYRVEISHPELKIPAEYNTATTLGYEPIFGQPDIEFHLSSEGKSR